MLQAIDVRLQFGSRVLFKDVNLQFNKGNCYGIIGANGAGKSTFLKLLTGELTPNQGEIIVGKNERMSVLNQNQNAYDDETILRTVLLGHKRLVEIMDEKEALYSKPDFNDEDGIRAGFLESEFSELDGWNAESDARMLLNGLGFEEYDDYTLMSSLEPKQKVKVLLAQAVFGNPDILILDEPTNNLDIKSIRWLENFLLDFENTVLIVSHNRHFLNKVCTHICDIDFGQINLYVGNYDFWYQSSQLLLKQQKDENKKMEQRAQELREFIARFSANASKSRQATSRKKELEKLTLNDIKPSSRKYPYIDFSFTRELGNEILKVDNLTKKGYFENLSFIVRKGDKICFLSDKNLRTTMLFEILMGNEKADSGTFAWGRTTIPTYLPQNNNEFFENCDLNLIQWIDQYSSDHYENYLRGWLGRMLFSGEEVFKQAKVLSGGERVRCMLSRMMLTAGNVLILDEPTNHLDLEAITSLNNGMIKYKGCMLFTSHDHEIMQTVANRIIDIRDEKTVVSKLCTYEEYLEMMGI